MVDNPRDLSITRSLLKKTKYLYIHTGKTMRLKKTNRNMIGYKVSQFTLTKRMGRMIRQIIRTQKKNHDKENIFNILEYI